MENPHIEDGTPTFADDEVGPGGGKIASLSELPEEFRETFRTHYDQMGIAEDGTVPPLDPELRVCVVEREAGKMINHPLVHTFYASVQNGVYNEMLHAKRKLIDELVEKGEYGTIFNLGLVERPYQLHWLNKWAEDIPDEAYWDLVGSVWTDSENIWQYEDEWRSVLSSNRPRRECIMYTAEEYDEDADVDRIQDERAFFEQLPEVIKVYRGTSAPNGLGSGFSWTLERERAIFFSKRLKLPGQTPRLISGKVRKENAVAFFDRRVEKEIVCLPEHVFDKMTKVVR